MYGAENGQFGYGLSGIAVDSQGNLHVADYSNNRIEKFDAGGNWQANWGATLSGFSPDFVALDAAGNLYVDDDGNDCIQRFDASGTVLDPWGTTISGFYPAGVALDAGGNLYVADQGNNCIQKLDPNGNLLATWANYNPGNGQFNWPNGMAVGGGRLYVTDSRVLVFGLPSPGLPFLNLLLN
jgi:DNA-binding beta-propeller fold protein YncE